MKNIIYNSIYIDKILLFLLINNRRKALKMEQGVELNDQQLLAILAEEEAEGGIQMMELFEGEQGGGEGGAPEGMEGVMIAGVEGNAHEHFGVLVVPGFELLADLEVLDAYWVCYISDY